MSRLDIITIAIVIACLGALGYLVYKIVSLMNPPEKAETSIQDTYPDASADESTYTDWNSESDTSQIDEDLDDDAFAAEGQKPASSYDASSYDDNELDAPAAEKPAASKPAPSKSAPAKPAPTKPAPTKPAPEATTTTTKGATSSSSSAAASATTSSAGKYMVLAGSFKQRANAETQVASLRKKGFANAQVSMFNRSAYAVVLVDRFDNYSAAKQLVADLKAKGVDALVKEQN